MQKKGRKKSHFKYCCVVLYFPITQYLYVEIFGKIVRVTYTEIFN